MHIYVMYKKSPYTYRFFFPLSIALWVGVGGGDRGGRRAGDSFGGTKKRFVRIGRGVGGSTCREVLVDI